MKKQYITPSIIVLDVCISNHLLRFSKAGEEASANNSAAGEPGWENDNKIDVDNGDDIWRNDFL